MFKGFLSGVEPVAIKIVGGSAAENTDDGVQRAMRELSLLKDCRSPQVRDHVYPLWLMRRWSCFW